MLNLERYFILKRSAMIFMISWTLIQISAKTPRQVENFHKQIAIAKAVFMFMKLIKCSMKHT